MRKIALTAFVAVAMGYLYPSSRENQAQVVQAVDKYSLGQQAMAESHLDEALTYYAQAIDIYPKFAPAYNNIGYILGKKAQSQDALLYHQEAARLSLLEKDYETYVSAYNNIGFMIRAGDEKSFEKTLKALEYFEAALAIQPPHCTDASYLMTLYNKASALCSIGQYDEALPLLKEVLKRNPKHAGAHLDLGTIYFYKGNVLKALYHQNFLVETAVEMRDVVGALNNKGQFLKELGLVYDAMKIHQQALSLDSSDSNTLLNIITARRQMCLWDDANEWHERLLNTTIQDLLSESIPSLLPYDATVMPISDSLKMQLAIANCKQWQQSITLVSTDTKYTTKPLKIGYMSYDYRNHPMGQLTVGAFEHHNHTAFHVTAYSYGPNDGSEWRHRIVHSADTFYDMQSWSDVDIANRIANDQISVLVDLMAHTRGARVGISSLHPAPILVNYLGYPGTMGASFMDYAILDAMVVPPMVATSTFTEKLVYLPHTYQVNDYDWSIDTCIHDCGDVPSVFGLNTSFVFCNFNTINKMEPLSFDSWMRILSRVPGSILWLLEPSALDIGVMNIFRLEAASRGIDPHRLVFAPRVSKREHLERLRHAHLFLDSFIYNAHSTASDMIWANLPLLTLQGDTFASRVAASLLQVSLGPIAASVLVAHSMKEYEEIAVALATTHRAKLSTIRGLLAESTLSSRLFDSAGTTAYLEESYKAMVDLAPDRMHIVIDPRAKYEPISDTRTAEHLMVVQTLAKQQANAFVEAEKGYRRLLVLRNNNSDAWHLYGLLHHQLNQSSQALPFVQQSIVHAPSAGFYRSNYAEILLALGDEVEAMEQFAIALHLDPRQDNSFQKLVVLLAKHEKHAQLIEAHHRYGFMHSFVDAMSEYEYWFQLSFAHAKLNDTLSAIKILEHYITAKPSTPLSVRIKAQYNTIVHLQTLGEYDKSNDLAFRTVLEEHVHNFQSDSLSTHGKSQDKKLVIYCNEYGLSWWPQWGPSSIDQGVGGSEEAVIYLARELASLGYQVRVYANPKSVDLGIDTFNVSWHHYTSFDISEPIDVFIAWRYHISVALAKSAKQTYVWLHDITDGRFFTPDFLARVTGVLCLSQFHAKEGALPEHEKIIISSNGLSASAFVDGDNIPTKFVYGSAPNRGLETILLNWKYLRSSIPNATLDVFYGFTTAFVKFAQPSASWRSQMEELLQQEGVAYHGLVDHITLATAYASAGFYLYPTTYPETSCVSIMRAMAAGAIPITTKSGAIAEVAGAFDLGLQPVDFDPNGQWVLDWLNTVIAASHTVDLQEHRRAMKEFARTKFLWSNIAVEWHELFNR